MCWNAHQHIGPVIVRQHCYINWYGVCSTSLCLSSSVIRLAIWNEHWGIVFVIVLIQHASNNLIANVLDIELHKQKLWAIINHYRCTTVKHRQWKPCLKCNISKGVTATQIHKPCCILLLNLTGNFSVSERYAMYRLVKRHALESALLLWSEWWVSFYIIISETNKKKATNLKCWFTGVFLNVLLAVSEQNNASW